MKTTSRLITPDIAKDLLSRNNMNRNLKMDSIAEYSRLMASGLWMEETGESIKIASDGTLLDGQQRLTALIKANRSLHFLVASDLDLAIFKVIDQGVKRSGGDLFATAKISNPGLVFAGIKRYFNLKSQVSIDKYIGCISNQEVFSIYSSDSKFWNASALMADAWYKKARILSKSEFLGFYAYFHEVDVDASFSFMDDLALGTALRGDSPISVLRNRLVLSNVSGKKITTNHRMVIIIKAWNYFRAGKSVTYLKYGEGELIPKPI